MTTNLKFEEWAIVEVMGHNTYAGFVSEQTLGGASFIRVDVPEVNGCPAFTKLLGAASIYAITPVSQEVATMRAKALRKAPITAWDLPDDIRAKIHAQPVGLPAPDDDDEDDARDPFEDSYSP